MKKNNSTVKVDLDKVKHNLKVIRAYADSDVRQMAVIKADAYGHGSVKLARAVEGQIDWFAVNELGEAVELRKAGIEKPILVFEAPYASSAELYTKHKLTATVSSTTHLDVLKPGTEYHLNVDTGMGRLGFLPDELSAVKQKMSEADRLTCTGIYSHFATADEPDSPLPPKQLEMFREVRAAFDPSLVTHMCNTGGSVFFPEAHFDMVRTGIGMYGYAPGTTEVEGLKPALTWETWLVHTKPVCKGTTVSYGCIWNAPEEGYVGVIPVGYDDGIRRNLTGQLQVNIGGQLYPVVGTITMNYCMIYLGKELPAEKKVSILDGETLTASTWAERLNTIPYEILTGISGRIPREYS